MSLGKDSRSRRLGTAAGGLKVGIELALTEQDEVVLSLARGENASTVFKGGTRDRSVQN